MNQHISRCGEVSRLNYYAGVFLAMWTLVVALSLWWNLAQLRLETAVGLWWGHGLLWLLGLGGIIIGFNRLRVAHERIITLMYTDTLTGIANRRIFLESLGAALSFAQRHQTPLSVIMADLDDFKSVNDTFGHNAGDQVLQAFAALLKKNSRQEDLAARFGGEEFIMMLPGTGAQAASVLGERLRCDLKEMLLTGFSIRVTASFGVAAYQPGDTVDGFIDRADQALYDAKLMGKNQVVVGEGTTEQVEEETRKLVNFLSLLPGKSWQSKLSVRGREAEPLREIPGKRSAPRRSQQVARPR
jgi:diguanylate cyclase (GGDEF)-like protein